MTSTADRAELVTVVDERLREVAKQVRRSMLDAMPDGEPSQWLYAPMREYPSRPGKAFGPRCVCRPGGHSAPTRMNCWVWRSLSSCCTTRSWFTTTLPMAAKCGVTGRLWRPRME